MDVQVITDRSFSVYIDKDELLKRNIDISSVSYETVRDIVMPLLSKKHSPNIKLELFLGKDDLLIFVKQDSGFPLFFKFTSFEALLSAVYEYPGSEPSALYLIDKDYILIIWSMESSTGFWEEFGDALHLPPLYISHLMEHGKAIFESDAIYKLRNVFSHL